MNFKKAIIVFRKEILEMLRDRRTLFTTIILPVVMYPLIFIGFSSIMSRQAAVLEKRGAVIAYHDSLSIDDPAIREVSQQLKQKLEQAEYVTLVDYLPATQQLYQEKEIQAVVTFSDSLTAAGLQTYKVMAQYDASNERSQLVYAKIKTAVNDTEKEVIASKLASSRIDPQIMNLFRLEQLDTSTPQKKMGMFLGMFLPYLLILMLVGGAATVAADIVAGEKERHTLETLLVSAVGRGEIVLGKYLTVVLMAMINTLVNLVSLSFSSRYLLSQSGLDTAGATMPVKAIFILLLALIPLATLFAALLLSISTFSRNMKEARTYEQPIMMVSMLLAMVSFIPSVEITNLLALIPVVNIALLFKAVMINEYQLSHLLLTIASTVVLDVIAIWITVKLFTTEAILFRTEEEGSLKNVRAQRRNLFNSYYGLIYFALALVALYYLGTKWQSADLLKGLVQTQLIIILLPVFVVLRAFKLKPNELLRLRLPKLKEVLLIPFIAIPGAIIVSQLAYLINLVFPFPPEYLEQLGKVFQLDASLAVMFLVIAVLPGICEEILFRGFLMRFYEGYGKGIAIVASALLFAIFHLDPFRFLPVFLLGLLLGYLTLRSKSIVNSMLSHAINNGLALFIVTYAAKPLLKPLVVDGEFLQWWLAIPAVIVMAAALWTFHKITADKEIS